VVGVLASVLDHEPAGFCMGRLLLTPSSLLGSFRLPNSFTLSDCLVRTHNILVYRRIPL